MEDREILAMLWDRNAEALDALAMKFGHRLQRLARNILPSDQDAQECVNDTYLALWNTIPPQRPEPLAPYVLRLCKNISVSRFRSITAKKRSCYEVTLDELSEAIGTTSLDETVDARLLGQTIDKFLTTLSKENRVIFLRRYWHGDSVQSIAQRMGLSENVVSVRLSRTREKLRAFLIKEGYYE